MRKFSTIIATAATFGTAIVAATPAHAAEVHGGFGIFAIFPILIDWFWGLFGWLFAGWTF